MVQSEGSRIRHSPDGPRGRTLPPCRCAGALGTRGVLTRPDDGDDVRRRFGSCPADRTPHDSRLGWFLLTAGRRGLGRMSDGDRSLVGGGAPKSPETGEAIGGRAAGVGERLKAFQAGRARAPVLLLWLAIAVIVVVGGIWIARRAGESGPEALGELF